MKNNFTISRTRIRNSFKLGLLVSVMASATPVQAKIIKYCIVTKTADQTDAGTSGYPEIAMSGEVSPGKRVYSGWKEIGGDQDRDSIDKLEIDLEDMGVVTTIDIENTSSNAWKLHYIRIFRNTGCNNTNAADGYSEFSINRWIEDEKISGFKPTDRSNARVTVSKEGRVVVNTEEFTVAHYAQVKGQREQMVMQFKESWSQVDAISMSTSSTNNIGASATLSYESPETVYGSFGASATAEWSHETSKAKEESSEKLSASEYDWSFVAPGNTFVIKKATFEVPYAHQLYRSSHNGKAYAVRTVGAQIIPSGDVGSFIEIPQRNEDGAITAIGLDDLHKNWLAYLQPGHAEKIRKSFLNEWLSKGYVVSGRGGSAVGNSRNNASNKPSISTPSVSSYSGNILKIGEAMNYNANREPELVSKNGQFRAVMQRDCNFVVYRTRDKKPLWASDTYKKGSSCFLEFQRNDGHLVLYDGQRKPLWATNKYEANPGKRKLVMQDDGNLVLYKQGARHALWASNTMQAASVNSANFSRTSGAAIPGHNNLHLKNVDVAACKRACLSETNFVCKSFDFYVNQNKCDLSDKRASDIGGLKTTYSGNPYDHYARK